MSARCAPFGLLVVALNRYQIKPQWGGICRQTPRWSDIFIGNIRQEGLHNAKSGSIYEFGYGIYLDLQVKGRDWPARSEVDNVGYR